MSDADNLQPIVTSRTVPAQQQQQQQQQANNSQSRMQQIENAIAAQLSSATKFPVRYELPKQMVTSSSERMALSIVRARLQKDWEVKQINTQLRDEDEATLCWLISPKRVPEQTKIGKTEDEEDDIDLKEIIGPLMGRSTFKF